METEIKLKRSKLWNKIYEEVKQLPRAEVEGDAVDHPSLTTTIEELFLNELNNFIVWNLIKEVGYREETANRESIKILNEYNEYKENGINKTRENGSSF